VPCLLNGHHLILSPPTRRHRYPSLDQHGRPTFTISGSPSISPNHLNHLATPHHIYNQSPSQISKPETRPSRAEEVTRPLVHSNSGAFSYASFSTLLFPRFVSPNAVVPLPRLAVKATREMICRSTTDARPNSPVVKFGRRARRLNDRSTS